MSGSGVSMESIEELFGSRGRTRILRVLSENGELNISEIGRSARMNHDDVNDHLEKLKESGLVREKRFGPIRIFQVAFNWIAVRFERGRGVRLDWDGFEDRP